MDEAGQKLKRARERLNLRFRDVEEASLRIAQRHHNDEFNVALSRLSDIENKGTVPTIYRLYSLSAIYRLNIMDVLEWYGVDVAAIPADAAQIEIERTHMIGFSVDVHGEVTLPLALDPGIDLRRTTYLSRVIQRWGKMPLMLLNGMDLRTHRYAYIGTEDWFMYPMLVPGSLIQIDESRRKIVNTGWTSEFERPIYLLEHRGGYSCAWANLNDGQLVLQPHPASLCNPEVYNYPDEIDIIGLVIGVAMRLDHPRRRRVRP